MILPFPEYFSPKSVLYGLLGVVTPLPKLTGCAAEKGTFLNINFRTKGCDIKRPSVQKRVHKGQCQKKMKNEKINKMNQGISWKIRVVDSRFRTNGCHFDAKTPV